MANYFTLPGTTNTHDFLSILKNETLSLQPS
jgi:hypothetical protein